MEDSFSVAVAILFLVFITFLALHGIIDVEENKKKRKTQKKVKGVNKALTKLESDLEKLLADKSKPVTKLSRKTLKDLRERANKLNSDQALNIGQFETLSKILGKLSGLKNKIEKHSK